MDIQYWLQHTAAQFKETGWLQWAGLIFGVTEVVLARANKIALYPAGIIASAIAVYLLWQSGLYGESLLSFYYIVMSIYGWWNWIKKKNKPVVRISWSTKSEWKTVIFMVTIGYLLLFAVLKYFTPSSVPHWDAIVTATAWAGMWLLARRKIENWILLNISNALAIPLLFHKGLALYAVLTIILFAVAVQGYFSWRKKLNDENFRIAG
jgi:nicotinamide mononucleotide transporter